MDPKSSESGTTRLPVLLLALLTSAALVLLAFGTAGAQTGAPATSTPTPEVSTPAVTNTPGAPATSTPAPPAATATSSIPTETPGPTFTTVPTAAATATLLPASQPTVAAATATPPPNSTPVDESLGGRFVAIPTAAPGQDAVAVLTPPAGSNQPTIILPAPAAGEPPQIVRVQPVPLTNVTLPPGVSAGRAVDLTITNQAGQVQHTHDRDIELSFTLTEADLAAAGNDPARIAIFRIDSLTGVAEPLPCNVDLAYRVVRCTTRKTSSFVLGQAAQASSVTYRNFVTNLVKNGRLVAGTNLPANGVSSVTLKNDSARAATVSALFYRDDGSQALNSAAIFTVPAGQSNFIYLPNITDLPDGNYSGIFESTEDIKAVANTGSSFTATTGPYGAASTSGTLQSQSGLQLFVPGVYKNYFGFTSSIRVQARSQTVSTAVTFNVVSTAGSTILTDTRTIAPGGATTFDLGATGAIPDGFLGSVIVNGDRDIVGTYFVSDSAGALSGGTAAISGTTQAYAPAVYSNYFGYDSSIVVQNVGSGPTDIQVTYSNGVVNQFTLAIGNSRVLFAPNEGLPQGFFGSAALRSTNGGSFVANVNVRNAARGNLETYDVVTGGDGVVNLPAVYKNYAPQQFVSSITLQNLGTVATNVTLTFENGTVVVATDVPAGGAVLRYLPNLVELPDGYNRGAVVQSSNGAPLAVIANIDAASGTLPAGDYLFMYRGFGGG